MKKAILITLSVLLILILGCLFTGFKFYTAGYRYDPVNKGMINIDLSPEIRTMELTLNEGGVKKQFPVDVTYTPFVDADVSNLFVSESDISYLTTPDEKQINDSVDVFLSLTKRSGMKAARLDKDMNFTETVQGNQVSVNTLKRDIKSEFPATGDFNVEDYYVVQTDNRGARLEGIYNRVENLKVTYENGSSICAMWMNPQFNEFDKTVTFDEDKIREEVGKLMLTMDDAGKKTISFNSTNMGVIPVQGGTWGHITDTKAETEYIIDKFRKLGEPEENRKPIMIQDLSWDLPRNYIEVDKKNQHVYVYENGRVIMDDDCVTGLYPRRKTPSGIFFISEKMKNKTLRGPGYASFVNRWMRLTNSGVGLHDATWRGRFGGEIYLRDGSHGCINLPKAFAYEVYDYVYDKENYCVVVHD
ncbi:MAG: L,D-transpeptidase [Lachnospiraceae bacterium]|nr:L,D-transpeptidase [Lachnospiraceae bacterium]